MSDWDDVRLKVETRMGELEEELLKFKGKTEEMIEAAKQADIIKSLFNINKRLDEIEKRLPSQEDKVGDEPTDVRAKIR